MDLLDELRKSGKKSKELNLYLANLILSKKPSAGELEKVLSVGNDAERGACIEAIEYASQKTPGIAKPYLPCILKSLTDKAPRVKWESARVIGNIASKYPAETVKAIEALLVNTKDKSTVVRWSAAFALGEIYKNNKQCRSILRGKIEAILKDEKNGGVRNNYLKALKMVEK